MQNLFRLILLAALVSSGFAAQAPRKLGEVPILVDVNTVPVRVSASSADLQSLAQIAFSAHGRYKLVASGYAFDIRFSAVAANQVKVDITRGAGATPVASQIVAGTTPRQALLRAADVAVEQTNGLGLKGMFTGRLAFVSQRAGKGDVYTSDLFLGEAKRVTHDNAFLFSPRWAPDGSRIIFTSYFKSGAPDIFLLDPNNGRKEVFVSFRGTNSGARFSPNGQQVAMICTGEGTPEVYIANAQGRKVARKTRSEQVKSSPAWSPDSTRIIFAMEPGPQLYVMPAGGGTPQRVVTGFSYAAEPDWSRAKPNKLACTVRVSGRYQIAVHDFSTGKTEVVSNAAFDGVEPTWLADGRHLVYTARDRSTSVLCILDTETKKSTRISPADSAALQASVWTP